MWNINWATRKTNGFTGGLPWAIFFRVERDRGKVSTHKSQWRPRRPSSMANATLFFFLTFITQCNYNIQIFAFLFDPCCESSLQRQKTERMVNASLSYHMRPMSQLQILYKDIREHQSRWQSWRMMWCSFIVGSKSNLSERLWHQHVSHVTLSIHSPMSSNYHVMIPIHSYHNTWIFIRVVISLRNFIEYEDVWISNLGLLAQQHGIIKLYWMGTFWVEQKALSSPLWCFFFSFFMQSFTDFAFLWSHILKIRNSWPKILESFGT